MNVSLVHHKLSFPLYPFSCTVPYFQTTTGAEGIASQIENIYFK